MVCVVVGETFWCTYSELLCIFIFFLPGGGHRVGGLDTVRWLNVHRGSLVGGNHCQMERP